MMRRVGLNDKSRTCPIIEDLLPVPIHYTRMLRVLCRPEHPRCFVPFYEFICKSTYVVHMVVEK